MIIIPAIDLIDGKCVRLTQGDYATKKIYSANPLEIAKQFEDIGITRLHLVDLDGAKQGKPVNLKVAETLASKTKLTIDFGGGIKTDEDLKTVFETGIAIATIGSIAVKNEPLFEKWITQYGPDKILLGADVKNNFIAIGGWLETTNISIFDFIEKNLKRGVRNIFCTDISKDGLLEGPATELYQHLINKFQKLQLIASGGVSKIDDLYLLEKIGCQGAIVGKAIYEERITLKEIYQFIKQQ